MSEFDSYKREIGSFFWSRIRNLEQTCKRLAEQAESHGNRLDNLDSGRELGYLTSDSTAPGCDLHELTRGLRRFSLWVEHPMGLDYICKGIGVRFPIGTMVIADEDHLRIYQSDGQMIDEFRGQGGRVRVQYLDSPA